MYLLDKVEDLFGRCIYATQKVFSSPSGKVVHRMWLCILELPRHHGPPLLLLIIIFLVMGHVVCGTQGD